MLQCPLYTKCNDTLFTVVFAICVHAFARKYTQAITFLQPSHIECVFTKFRSTRLDIDIDTRPLPGRLYTVKIVEYYLLDHKSRCRFCTTVYVGRMEYLQSLNWIGLYPMFTLAMYPKMNIWNANDAGREREKKTIKTNRGVLRLVRCRSSHRMQKGESDSIIYKLCAFVVDASIP